MKTYLRNNALHILIVAFMAVAFCVSMTACNAQAADPPAKAKAELVAAPSAAVAASTHGYGVLAVSEQDAIGCANKDNCILVSREAFGVLIGRINKAKAAAATAVQTLEALQAAKDGGKCT